MNMDRQDTDWLNGNGIEALQWESGNAASSFPFEDNTLPEGFPVGAVVDACIVVTATEKPSTAAVSLGCLHISRYMVSVMILVDGLPALCRTMLAAENAAYRPLQMESLLEGCAGTITFGGIRFDDYITPFTWRGKIPLSDAAVVRPVVGRLRRFFKYDTGQSTSGDVAIELPDGVSMSVTELDSGSSEVTFSANDNVREEVRSPCESGETDSGLTPMMSINNIRPDSLGRIAIVFGKAEG